MKGFQHGESSVCEIWSLVAERVLQSMHLKCLLRGATSHAITLEVGSRAKHTKKDACGA